MAVPIKFVPATSESVAEIDARLEQARISHAKAILSAYELLQQMHDAKVLDIFRGLLDAGDSIVVKLATASNSEETINVVRNLISLSRLLGSVDPELLHSLADELSIENRRKANAPPPTLWGAIRTFIGKDSRRAIAGSAAFVQAFGRALAKSSR